MYRTTSKSLDRRLSKDEQLVYMKCFVPKSLADLQRVTSLEQETLKTTLERLIALGFLREMTDKVVQLVNPKATLTPETMNESTLSRAKRKLSGELERVLAAQSEAFVPELQRAQSIPELKGTARKILVKLRLTVSQAAAKEFETSIGSLLDEV